MLTLATMSNNASTIVFSDYFPEKKCNIDVSVKQVMSIRVRFIWEFLVTNPFSNKSISHTFLVFPYAAW